MALQLTRDRGGEVDRRRFVATIGSLLALGAFSGARVAHAQAGKRGAPYRIAMFPDLIPVNRAMLSDAIREIGWLEGSEVQILESGLPYGGAEVDQAAKRVVALRPDLIFATTTAHTMAMRSATTTIPIVMWASGYPVEAGLADSLARPGKNVTGNSLYAGTGLWGKVQQLLCDAKPGIRRIGVCWGYVPPAFPQAEIEPCYRELRRAAQVLGVEVNIVEFPSAELVPAALAKIDAGRPDALVLTSGPAIWEARRGVMEFAVKRHLPTVLDWAWPLDDLYPLFIFAPPTIDLFRSSVAYVKRIREGELAGSLPIQLPAKFELVVNLRSAQAIGLRIPQSVLLRAERVID